MNPKPSHSRNPNSGVQVAEETARKAEVKIEQNRVRQAREEEVARVAREREAARVADEKEAAKAAEEMRRGTAEKAARYAVESATRKAGLVEAAKLAGQEIRGRSLAAQEARGGAERQAARECVQEAERRVGDQARLIGAAEEVARVVGEEDAARAREAVKVATAEEATWRAAEVASRSCP